MSIFLLRKNSFTFSVIQCYIHCNGYSLNSLNPSHSKKKDGDGGGWLYSGQHTYVTGLTFSLFFKICFSESILISREYLFRETCFLLASNSLSHKFFPM